VSTISNGQEALRLFDQEQPDLVILDVLMEGIDGFETCRRLRQRSDVPIIMLSGVDQTDYMVRGMACGADDYITKPFHLTVLCARIRAALRRAGHAAALSSQPERRRGWAAF
jgi:DNA-binding response OmpR family regulator